MKDRDEDLKHDSIDHLIQTEVDGALDRFRPGDFEAKVRRNIRGITAEKSLRAFAHGFPHPFWIAAALGLLSGVMAILIVFHKTPRAAMAQAIESILQQTPGILALENRDLEGSRAEEPMISSPMNIRIQKALIGGHQESGETPLPREESMPSGEGRRTRPMTIEETYKILIIDKSIARVFALIS